MPSLLTIVVAAALSASEWARVWCEAVQPIWQATKAINAIFRNDVIASNDNKLSDRGARRGLCAGDRWMGAKAVESTGRDVRSGSLQRTG